MCHERKNILRNDTIARKKGMIPLLGDSEREDLTRRVNDDHHATVTYFKRIENHYDGYLKHKEILNEISKDKKKESTHYVGELERSASTLVHQCMAFNGFSQRNYKILNYLLKKKDKNLNEVLDEIKERYGFKFHI
ncbi:hypothetical protein J4465_00210 [Candidatus Pacearchaeota archaeon]|nr:hypothetical protein [Candidatus Pacearchaeota archaeon]